MTGDEVAYLWIGLCAGVILTIFWFDRHEKRIGYGMVRLYDAARGKVHRKKGVVTAREIDPSRPPTYKIYNPKRTVTPPVCGCHSRPIKPGQKVLFWPVPGSPAVDIFCEDGIEAAQ